MLYLLIMAKKFKYKEGDKIVARLFGGERVTGVIKNIEYDELKRDYVADLDCGHWCYLDQIINKVN